MGESAKVSIVGPIWFLTSAIEPPQIPERTIAVFDVQPMRSSFYRLLSQEVDYYVPTVCTEFLTDSLASIQLVGAGMGFKRKRQHNSKGHHPS